MSLLVTIYRDRKKTIIQQLCEIKLLASDLTVNNTQLRDMISQSFTMVGISESWLRKLLSEYLKSTKLTRKDYPDLQQPRDHQPLQQQQQELAELPSSSSSSTRHPGLEQQPSDDEVQKTRVTTYDNNNVAVRRRYKNEQVSLEGKVTMIRRLEKKLNNYRRKLGIYIMCWLLNNNRKKHSQHLDVFNFKIMDVPIKIHKKR
jgi:hypothetical protein